MVQGARLPSAVAAAPPAGKAHLQARAASAQGATLLHRDAGSLRTSWTEQKMRASPGIYLHSPHREGAVDDVDLSPQQSKIRQGYNLLMYKAVRVSLNQRSLRTAASGYTLGQYYILPQNLYWLCHSLSLENGTTLFTSACLHKTVCVKQERNNSNTGQ